MSKNEMTVCPRCNRPAWKPDKVARVGKNPEKQYWYLRYRHPIDGRTKRNKTCYLSLNE
ncbi:MAG TPA: hypothetical protein VFF30_17860 [Nitrososphaerales archaeon]|nr:hypothetical protein [Nitrososphaerales archaeon]